MRANTIISKYKYPFMSRERSTLVATLTYVPLCMYIVSDTFTKWWRALWGTPAPTTTQNPHIYEQILFANTNKTPKCVGMNPNKSEYFYCCLVMTHPWHTCKVRYSTVLISYIVMYPPVPAKNKSKAVWIPVSHFTHLKLCMAQPPALPIYKKGIIERITVVMHTLFTFCTHHTSNHKNLFKIVNGT